MGVETLIATTLTAFFSNLGLGTTLASVAAAVVVTAALLGASYLLSSMQKKPKASDQQQTIKQAIIPRQRTYGTDVVGGGMAFYETRNGTLYIPIIHGEGPIQGYLQNWLNDKQGAADMSAGSGLSPWNASVSVVNYLGSTTQAASSVLMAAFPGVWTSAHQLKGLAYSVVRIGHVAAKNFQKTYPNGVPQHRVVIEGAIIYDPRDAATRFSANPALCIRDYLTHARGLAISSGLIDDASFSTFATICSQPVTLAAGGTEPVYSLSYTYKLTDEPRAVLADLLRSCDAELYATTDGKVGIRGGVWTAPTEVLTADDVLNYTFKAASGVNAEFNRLTILFKDPLNDYQPVEVSAWNEAASQAVVGVISREFNAQMITSHTRARRLAKIFMARSNPAFRLNATIRYSAAIRLWGERMASVTLSELGLTDEPFMIASASLSPGEMTGTVELVHLPASAYAWSTAEEGPRPVVPADTAGTPVAPTPTGVTADLEWSTVSGGVIVGRIAIEVDPLTGDAASFQTVGQYKLSSSGDWLDMAEDGPWRVLSPIVTDGETYNVRVAHAYSGGAQSPSLSAWVTPSDVVVVADPTAPAAASAGDFDAVAASPDVVISWTMPNFANVSYGTIYRGTSASFGAATAIATVYGTANTPVSYTDAAPGTGTFYYWIKAFNGSGVGSAAEGPDSVVL